MPGEDLQSWSTTAATNSGADSSINWAEGMARAAVNNSARSMMAAHAKDRNLRNGSIVTGGTANAQTFASGLTYTTTPTGLRVTLKIGPALTNTGAATLNMDGIGDVAIKDEFGNFLIGNELPAGSYVEFIYDGANWIALAGAAAGAVTPQHGQLSIFSATFVQFTPYNGNRIKVNGSLYQIPAAGIAGLGNSGVFVNGVAAQPLVANTTYLVFAFVNSGVVTGDFRSGSTHATSTAGSNAGTEILTGDDSRTLIGMVRTDASAVFQDSVAARGVISWFNRKPIALAGASTGGIPVASTTNVELTAAARFTFLSWAEAIPISIIGSAAGDTVGMIVSPGLSLDFATTPITAGFSILGGGFHQVSQALWTPVTEGWHTITPHAAVTSGTGTFFVAGQGAIRG